MNNYLLCEDRRISGIDEWSLIILGLQNMTTPLEKSSSFFNGSYYSTIAAAFCDSFRPLLIHAAAVIQGSLM